MRLLAVHAILRLGNERDERLIQVQAARLCAQVGVRDLDPHAANIPSSHLPEVGSLSWTETQDHLVFGMRSNALSDIYNSSSAD